jgi:hypothetical protein
MRTHDRLDPLGRAVHGQHRVGHRLFAILEGGSGFEPRTRRSKSGVQRPRRRVKTALRAIGRRQRRRSNLSLSGRRAVPHDHLDAVGPFCSTVIPARARHRRADHPAWAPWAQRCVCGRSPGARGLSADAAGGAADLVAGSTRCASAACRVSHIVTLILNELCWIRSHSSMSLTEAGRRNARPSYEILCSLWAAATLWLPDQDTPGRPRCV